jgi:hypothetical protein
MNAKEDKKLVRVKNSALTLTECSPVRRERLRLHSPRRGNSIA